MRVVPSRDGFFKALGKGEAEDAVMVRMKDYLDAMSSRLDIIETFYKDKGLEP